ncbi:uncharacterized protein LOC144137607 [Haemaphysalis longicornis]
MSHRSTWRFFRALIDPSQTRTETQKHLQRALHAYAGDADKLSQALRDKYICGPQDSIEPAFSYAGSENADLDRCFQLHDLKAALSKMKRGTAPGRDQVTVKLLANLPDPAYLHLLDYFNQIWEGREPLPIDWKTALVTFIPKPGKSINIENLRPISLTSCVGKLMETMVRDRLSDYLEVQHTFADTMHGFRPHRSAQDILLQLHRDVIEPIEHPSNDKVVLALDLKGAFDNVTHEIILTHLSQTNCGYNAFRYIRQFLTERQSYLRIQGKEHGPYPLGTRGTPQGAVLSPLLFNLAMAHLPPLLKDIPGVRHALYADDITLWATQGSLGSIEASLQHAATVVDEYARRCGLECSPAKSEYVHLRPKPKDTTQIALSLSTGPIPEREEIRVLGLFIHKSRKVDTTLRKLRMVGDQVGRMVRRVSNKRGGLRSHDALRLANAFVTSRILYSTPYLRLRKCDVHTLEGILRKIYKRALDLPISTSNQRLADLGMTNTYGELKEAHLHNQYLRLTKSHAGRCLLQRLHISYTCQAEERTTIPEDWRGALDIQPLPQNMARGTHEGRRTARVTALQGRYGSRPGVFYTDASGPHHGGWYTAAVIHQNVPVQGLTFRAPDISHAEEVAIALAAADPASRIIITDSRSACQNLTKGRITIRDAQILKGCYYMDRPNTRSVIWTPAHAGLGGNEAADASARALDSRDPPRPPSLDDPEPNPVSSFRDITAMYKSNRLRFPPPAPGLTKADERWLLRLYTNTVLCPAILRHFNPAFSGECPHCDHPFADTFHMVWACPSNPAVPPITSPSPPTRESWESTLEGQRALVARARAAAEATGVPD